MAFTLTRDRRILILVGVVALSGLGGAAYFFQVNQRNLQQFQATEQRMRQNLADFQAENARLGDQLQQLFDDKKVVEERFSLASQDLEQVTTELLSTKDHLQEVSGQVTFLQEEREALARQVEELSQVKETLEGRVAQLEGERTAQEQVIAELRAKLATLEQPRLTGAPLGSATGSSSAMMRGGSTAVTPPDTALASVNSSTPGTIALPPIIVQQGKAVVPQPVSFQGKIVSLNTPHQFVVIDKGANDGVQIGDRFLVMRGQQKLGLVEAIRVRATITACDTRQVKGKTRLRVGDLVTLHARPR